MPGQQAASARLAPSAHAYAAFLRQHIELETHELFPAVEAALGDADQALVDAFERIEVERIGAGTHEPL